MSEQFDPSSFWNIWDGQRFEFPPKNAQSLIIPEQDRAVNKNWQTKSVKTQRHWNFDRKWKYIIFSEKITKIEEANPGKSGKIREKSGEIRKKSGNDPYITL